MKVSRRSALMGSAAWGSASLVALNGSSAHAAIKIAPLDFTDPITALRTHVKMVGSLSKTTIYSFMRLNIYADLGEGNFVPFFTMNNILVDYWQPKGDNQFEMRKYEVGFYTRYDS